MKNFKSERGAITIIALASVLLITAFLITTYTAVSNKVKTQKEVINETKKIYETESAEEAYNSFFKSADIIPIYSEEQLVEIGSDKTILISQTQAKYFRFANDATYVLMNDLNLTIEWEPPTDDENSEFEGIIDYNGHTITTLSGKIYPEQVIDSAWVLANLKSREIIRRK